MHKKLTNNELFSFDRSFSGLFKRILTIIKFYLFFTCRNLTTLLANYCHMLVFVLVIFGKHSGKTHCFSDMSKIFFSFYAFCPILHYCNFFRNNIICKCT